MKRYFEIIMNVIILLNITFLLVFISEFLVRGDARDVVMWIRYYDIEFILTWVLVLGIVLVIGCIINSIAYGYLITAVAICTISIINYYMLAMKGEQLSVQDFALAGEFATMAGDLEIHISSHLIWGCLLALLIFLLLKEVSIFKLKKRVRGVGTIMSVAVLFMMHGTIYGQDKVITESFLLTLANSATISNIDMPIGYTKENVEAILKNVQITPLTHTQKPNVIMIMSESFFHMKELEGISLSENPYDYFDQLSDSFSSGYIVGPKVAGYTAQTEYEVLTGNSTDFTGVNNIAYLRYIKSGVHGLPKIFKEAGYSRVAIHPYDEAFYSRDEVYKKMGFETFITRDDFKGPTYVNNYISDAETFNRIIENYEERDGNPFFAHVVTMQNHTPYEKLDKPTVQVMDDHISKLTKDTLESYASSIKETDKALKDFISYFEKVEEPTVILFFGDHIPVFGDEIYDELNFFDIDQMEDYMQSATTPYLIWNNYGLEEVDYPYIDASYLGAVLLNEIGFEQDRYFNYLASQLEHVKAYHSNFVVDGMGRIIEQEAMTKEQEKALENLWMLQYDHLFGKNYGGR